MRLLVVIQMLLALSACQRLDVVAAESGSEDRPASFMIRNVIIVDGSGKPGFAGSVRVSA